ncbi:MAG TPA: ABC transporter permease [Flavobacteriales bacterium]|nr:ABC transporter permease [Flavobacteriales bacterium]HNK68152.1 ABC transporter permease [Flavobacteriales bacterium]HNK84240.1 ABC transporter permease [Flavobacteriales bacterium]HNM70322.1 ABC transporter permease [Flavobacteriales bacterium]
MFDRERWNEVMMTLRRNKLRSFLTMLGVAWGIFMLVVMLGMGNGLKNAVLGGFDGFATNSAFLWTMPTTKPWAGFQRGRHFNFDNEDTRLIREQVPGIETLSPQLQLGGWRGGNNVNYGNKTAAFSIYGSEPDVIKVEAVRVVEGRFLNALDLHDERKVCVIGEQVVDRLFEQEDPMGKYIRISGVYFKVVGRMRKKSSAQMGDNPDAKIYVPFTTYQKAFNSMNIVHWYNLIAKPGVQVSEVERGVKQLMARKHKVDPTDENAFGSFNMQDMYQKMNLLFLAISSISWTVGIFSLLAGAIGIGNIMLVSIKERTKEIGVRRSLGATPRNITGQIMQEALTLILIAGYFGLLAGVGVLEGARALTGEGSDFFKNPGVGIGTALVAFGVLVVSGLFAGFLPARRALAIKAVDALRAE